MDAFTALTTRKSSRSFSSREVPDDILEKIVDAARLAATARNLQPWEFAIIKDSHKRAKIASWADNGRFIRQAPVCLAILSIDTKYYLEDGSAATQNAMVAATALGVQSCWVAGDKKPYAADVCALLNAPKELRLISLIALGYEDRPSKRPPKRSLSDVLHQETF